MDGTKNRRTPRQATVRRLPVPLSERDERDLATIRNSPAALERIGAKADDSDASLVHALMEVGARTAAEAAEEAEYAAFAEWSRTDPEERAIETLMRRRRENTDA